jgi:hypothetical protein
MLRIAWCFGSAVVAGKGLELRSRGSRRRLSPHGHFPITLL